jgi:6-pyruvoyl-tetrahydropterin synthase
VSKRFPRAQVEVWYGFHAQHTVQKSKHPDAKIPHWHEYKIAIGYHHERNGPFTWDRQDLHANFAALLVSLDGKYLNDVIKAQASDEELASWCVKQLPGWVDYVTIERDTPEEASIKSVTTVRRRDLE